VRKVTRHSARGRGPKRDVVWGFNRREFVPFPAGDPSPSLFAYWVQVPARALPATTPGTVGQAVQDSTLIRTLIDWTVGGTLTADPGETSILTLGLILWDGTDGDAPPTDYPNPDDGTWDWIWRWPIIRPSVGGGSVAVNFPTTMPQVESRAQRKMGADSGLLMCMSLHGVDDVFVAIDVRQAFKLPF